MRFAFAPAFVFLTVFAVCTSADTRAADIIAAVPATALTLFDAYLAEAALTTPLYRVDVQAGGDPQHIPLGRLFGQGPMIGPFTYRPKTYDELTREERADLLRDPKFHSFLIASREHADRAESEDAPVPRPTIEKFSISPSEMLQRRPIFVVLSSS